MKKEGRVKMEEMMFCGMLRIGMVIDWLVFGEEEVAVGEVDVEDERHGFCDTEDDEIYCVFEDGQE